MSPLSRDFAPAVGTRSTLVGFVLAALLAFAYMATAAAEDASARDIVISDSSSPLSAGTGSAFGDGTAPQAGSPATTQSGSCTTPNVSIRPTALGAVTSDSTRLALAKAFNPASLGVQAGDSVYFCNVAGGNTYSPSEAGTSGTSIDLSVTPSITIAAFPGQTPILEANNEGGGAGAGNFNFFSDTSTQGRNFTLKDLALTQDATPVAAFSGNGGFMNINNAVNPGSLVLNNVSADGFAGAVNGGVVAAENVEVVDSDFGTIANNTAVGAGGAIDADGNVTVTNSEFGDTNTTPAASGNNVSAGFGGAIAAGGNTGAGNVTLSGSVFEFNRSVGNDGGAIDATGNVTVVGTSFADNRASGATSDGGSIDADGSVTVSGAASSFIGDNNPATNEAGRDGGAINAQSVTISNASGFGASVATPAAGFGLNAGGNGGAIATVNSTTNCANNPTPATCIPGTVNITGAASFTDNTAALAGGAIFAAGGINVNGSNGTTFTAGSEASTAGANGNNSYGNEAAGGGAIAVGGLFQGTYTAGPPEYLRQCHPAASSSIKNLSFTRQLGGATGGGAVHVLASASDAGATGPAPNTVKTCAVEVTGNTFTANASGAGNGGALYVDGGNVTTDNTYTSNGAPTIAGVARTTANGGAVATAGTVFAVVNDTGSSYSGNVANVSGGAVRVAGTSTVNISEAGFNSNVATTGTGGAIAQAGAAGQAVSIETSEFTGNQATNGGALSQAGAAGTLDVSEVEFALNSVGAGTAAAAPGAGVPNSPATGNGGAVYLATTLGGTATTLIEKADFLDNSAGTTNGWGGAVFQLSGGVDAPPTATSETSNTVLQEVLFDGNSAPGTNSGSGGAVSSVAFGGNPAGAAGPPVIPPTFNMVIDEVDFQGNSAQDNGGAVSLGYTAGPACGSAVCTTPVRITNSTADANRAIDGAGGTVYGDVASVLQAGVFDAADESITEEGIAVTGSKSGTHGGAVASVGGGGLILIGSAFTNNKNGQNAAGTGIGTAAGNTGARGGAVYFTSPGAPNATDYLILGSQFVGNESAKDGGAIYTEGNGAFDPANDDFRGIGISAFAFNSAGKANTLANQSAVGGAVAYASGAASTQASLSNLFIANNVSQSNTNAASTSYGGAIGNINAGTVYSYRNTFDSNEVSSSAATPAGTPAAAAGAIYSGGSPAVNLVNSTLSGNSSPGPASVAWNATGGSINLLNSTVSGNGSPLTGGSLLQVNDGTAAGTITAENSILAEGVGVNSNCVAQTLTNNGGNVLTDTTACGGNAFVGTGGGPATKVTAAALDLKPLANNGNSFSEDLPLTTMALGFGSVAKSSSADCSQTELEFFVGDPVDERGLVRPATNCSSGAFQLTAETFTVSKAGAGSGTVASDPAGIDCGPGCQSQTSEFAATPPSTLVTLTATPEAGSEFQSWTGNCVEIAGNVCVVDADNVNNITANFSTNLRRLTVSVVGNGEGKVTSSPAGIDCGTACEGDFDLGTTVTLTAAASGQSAFAGWGGACASAGTSATCQVTMDQARSATATFTQNALVKIVKVKQGTIRVPGNRTISVGRVECVNGTCNIAQATARVRVRGVTYRASVKGQSGSFTTGQSRTVKVVVPKAAYRNLRTKKSGSVTLVLRATAEVPGQSPVERNKNISNGLRR